MMKASFAPVEKRRNRVFGLCFLVLIMAGWALTLWLTGALSIGAIDAEPFLRIEQNDYLNATPSLLYTLFIGLAFKLGAAFGGFNGGLLVFALVQSLLLASVCSYASFWLFAKGAPLWLAFIFAVVFAAFILLACAVTQPKVAVLIVAIFVLVVLKLINAVEDNCARLRRALPVCTLLILLVALLFLDLAMVVVVVLTLCAICLTPSRVKGRLTLCALAVFALSAGTLCVVFPLLGWTGDPLVWLRESLVFELRPLFIAPGVIMLALLVFVLGNRRPRFILPFIPLISFLPLPLLMRSSFILDDGLSISVFVLCLPFCALIPFMREYHETKDELRKRVLSQRAAIPSLIREARSEAVCSVLLRKLMNISPDAGFIGLYSARGSELSLGLLAVQLSALGYRTAYPAMLSDTEMSFFTTLDVSDEALFTALLKDDPFKPVAGTALERLHLVEPSAISALVAPGVAFDKDWYRTGYGKGYYDRYIPHLRKGTPVWGVGFYEQLVEAVPVTPHDTPLTALIIG
ncbi:MAG: 5-formyltetrahydrofolate cyclo-ligase [Coriobacteriales bacterium]|nr:5-formyltetrahydrofolate cyclo-ligase [Coriobacteriales bacterium]